jgi:hypothetical protein
MMGSMLMLRRGKVLAERVVDLHGASIRRCWIRVRIYVREGL